MPEPRMYNFVNWIIAIYKGLICFEKSGFVLFLYQFLQIIEALIYYYCRIIWQENDLWKIDKLKHTWYDYDFLLYKYKIKNGM